MSASDTKTPIYLYKTDYTIGFDYSSGAVQGKSTNVKLVNLDTSTTLIDSSANLINTTGTLVPGKYQFDAGVMNHSKGSFWWAGDGLYWGPSSPSGQNGSGDV